MLYGVRERKGFIVLTGEIGTGKTTLLRALLSNLDRDTHVAYSHDSASGIEGLLEYILQDWGVKSTGATHAQRLFELNEFLIDQHHQGRSPVLVIDDAQDLSVPTLEALRRLSNFETTGQKPMQILLVGQLSLREKLHRPELRQLKQRIGLRCHIGPLSPDETRLYIRHRLRIAGASDVGIFTDAAVRRITEYSQSSPASSTSSATTVCSPDSPTASAASTPAWSRRRSNISRRASSPSGSAAGCPSSATRARRRRATSWPGCRAIGWGHRPASSA